MNEKIEILSAKKEHYKAMLRIYNEGFLPKFAFVTQNFEKQQSFVDDFGVINIRTPNKEFVAVKENQVLGILSLRYKGLNSKEPKPNLPLGRLVQKYGALGILRAVILGQTFGHHPTKGELYIESLGVAHQARGQGVGSHLLKFADNFARDKGLNQITLSVMFENPRAKALYERNGFSVESSTRFPKMLKTTGYSGAFFMVKNLNRAD